MVAAARPPSPSVVDRAPGLWVYEHLLALGIEGEALEFAAPLLGSDDAGLAAEAAVERSARLRARIALHSVADALAKEPDTLEMDAGHCAALRVFRGCLTEHAGADADALERDCALDRLFAAVVVRSNDWNAYKKALDALFPPDVRALSEKGKSPVASPEKDQRAQQKKQGGGLRPELLATFSRCRSGADENHLKAQRRKHSMSLEEMRQVARNACAVGASKYLGKDSLRVIAQDLAKGTYAPSRGALPPPARGGAAFTKKAKANAKVDANAKTARERSSPESRARVSPSPRKKPILKPRRKRLEKAPTRADARETTPSGDAKVTPRSREDAAFDDAPKDRHPHDPYDFRNEDNAATRAFAALGAAAAAMEAEDEYYDGGGGGGDDDADGVRDATPMQKVMKSLGWRRGGGGVGSDRGAESDEEEEAVAPTQAAPDEGEEEGGGGGLLSRVGGWIGLGRSGGAKRKRPEEEDDDDEEDEGIATTASMRERAEDQTRERRTRASRQRASAPASSPLRASSPAGSPKIDGARRKRRKGPLGNSNRHSKRAALEANVPSLPRKKRVMWTPEETAALEAGVRALEKEGRFDMGAVDLRDGTVNDKWRRIYDAHKETFDVNGRTTMDLKDKWRNIVNARAKSGDGGDADAAGASPSSWRRAMINLGLVKAPPVKTGAEKSPGAAAARSAALREPGVSNRHSALRKKLGFSDGTRKRAQPWLDEEVDALRAGVEKEGEGKWATILKAAPEVFLDRSAVDLKDKWRNLKGRATRTARKRVNGLDAPLSARALALAAEAAAAAAAAAETAPSTNENKDVVNEGDAPSRDEEDESDGEP